MSTFLTNGSINESDIDLAYNCLCRGRFAEGFMLLQKVSDNARSDVLFNIGLCYMRAFDFTEALNYFEKALSAIQRIGIGAPIKKDTVYIKLRENDIKNEAFLQPVNKQYIECFTTIAKENTILSLTKLYSACGMNDKAKKLANTLIGEEFAAIKNQF